MTCMRARTSLNFGLIGQPTAELAALEIITKSLDPLKAKKTFIRKKLGHTAISVGKYCIF